MDWGTSIRSCLEASLPFSVRSLVSPASADSHYPPIGGFRPFRSFCGEAIHHRKFISDTEKVGGILTFYMSTLTFTGLRRLSESGKV